MELAEGSSSEMLRPVNVELKLPDETFTDDLGNPQSAEYEAKRTKMEEIVCINVLCYL